MTRTLHLEFADLVVGLTKGVKPAGQPTKWVSSLRPLAGSEASPLEVQCRTGSEANLPLARGGHMTAGPWAIRCLLGPGNGAGPVRERARRRGASRFCPSHLGGLFVGCVVPMSLRLAIVIAVCVLAWLDCFCEFVPHSRSDSCARAGETMAPKPK